MRFLFEIGFREAVLQPPLIREFACFEIAREAAILSLQRLAELRLCSLQGSVLGLRVVSELGVVVFQGDLIVDPVTSDACRTLGGLSLAA